jgi:4-cresol dehydrogenase (hydroxylating)
MDYAPTPEELDRGDVGILWYAPAVELKGDAISRVVTMAEPIFAKHGFDMLTMFTFVTDRHGVAVFNILYDARHEKEAARSCYQDLLSRGREAGFFPYRLPAFAWNQHSTSAEISPLTALHQQLKSALDPEALIARGRYGIGQK